MMNSWRNGGAVNEMQAAYGVAPAAIGNARGEFKMGAATVPAQDLLIADSVGLANNGWRIGWAIGNATLINALFRVKDNLDSGIPQAIQRMAITALDGPQDVIDEHNRIYEHRRDILCEALPAEGGIYGLALELCDRRMRTLALPPVLALTPSVRLTADDPPAPAPVDPLAAREQSHVGLAFRERGRRPALRQLCRRRAPASSRSRGSRRRRHAVAGR